MSVGDGKNRFHDVAPDCLRLALGTFWVQSEGLGVSVTLKRRDVTLGLAQPRGTAASKDSALARGPACPPEPKCHHPPATKPR